jgi:CRISPR-associated protein Cas2
MPRKELILSEYRGMWLFAMFDLPVDSPRARKRYTEFRKTLIKQGFSMLQYSIYARYCASEEASVLHRSVVRRAIPPEGYVRLLLVTDRQFGKMESFVGEIREAAEKPPSQLQLF